MSNMGSSYLLDDRNFLKCNNCGKYKVDTNEEFHIVYKGAKKYWLCDTCNKYYPVFKRSSEILKFIIAPGEGELEFKVYKREMYV